MYENVKFVDEKGNIKDKDISLVKESKGYGIVENEIDLFFPENPSEGIDVEYAGYTVKLIPQGGSDKVVAKQNAEAVIYEEFFDENSSLKYTPLLSGVKEDIILASYAKNVSYDFIVETDGLYIYNDDEGYYLADETNTKIVFYLGDVEVYDAIGKPCMGEMEVSVLQEGQKYMLTLSVRDEFLSDPETVYPVTIDPTLTISDTETGADSIIDAPIFKAKSNTNYAKYKYNTVGTTTASYGIGRTVVKLPGLTSSAEYKTIIAEQIESVKFYVRDSSGTGKQTIYLYPLSNTAWTETSVTWNNVGSYYSNRYSTTLSSGKVSAFDITNLVIAWKNNKFSAAAGFILINSTETNNKSFCSSEYSTTSYRPYVEMTYTTALSLNKSEADVVEGGTCTVKASTNPSGQSITWKCSNNNVAQIISFSNSSCVIRAKKAGTVTITATMTDADGKTHTESCIIYVYIANGVYNIQNMNSGYYLSVNGLIKNQTGLVQSSNPTTSTSLSKKLSGMWKIYYLGSGRYTVRPMHKLNMALDVTASTLDINAMGQIDSLEMVPKYGQWIIQWDDTGYLFENSFLNDKTMQVKDGSSALNASVVMSSYSSSLNCKWSLAKVSNPPSGILLYNAATAGVLSTSYTQAVAVGEMRGLSEMNMISAVYSGSTINQTVYWESLDKGIATVNKTTGAVTGVSERTITITAYSAEDNSLKTSYQLTVLPLEDGTYQRWMLSSLENGYYKITSEGSGLALSVKSTEVSNQDASLVQESYTGTYRQQWKVTQTENGSYKIKPRSSENLVTDLVMAVGDSDADELDGVTVEQRSYIDNESYEDEWYLYVVERAFSVGGEITDGIDVTMASRKWAKCGYQSEYDINPSLATLSEYNLDSSVVYLSAHGSQHEIAFLNELGLSDGSVASSENMVAINNLALSQAKLYVYNSCFTASDSDGKGYNLCTETIAAGVDCVIGWTEEVSELDALNWQMHFQSELVKGKSVKEAADYANTFGYIDTPSVKEWRIFGDENLIINMDAAFENELSENYSIETASYVMETAIPSFIYSASNVETVLNNNFDSFVDIEHIITKTNTNKDGSNYVVDWRYLYNGFVTDYGYSIIVNDGTITAMREYGAIEIEKMANEYSQNSYTPMDIAAVGNDMVVPEITQMIIDEAMLQAKNEVFQAFENSIIVEQQGEKYYNIAELTYYYRVKTVYHLLNGGYGVQFMDYKL